MHAEAVASVCAACRVSHATVRQLVPVHRTASRCRQRLTTARASPAADRFVLEPAHLQVPAHLQQRSTDNTLPIMLVCVTFWFVSAGISSLIGFVLGLTGGRLNISLCRQVYAHAVSSTGAHTGGWQPQLLEHRLHAVAWRTTPLCRRYCARAVARAVDRHWCLAGCNSHQLSGPSPGSCPLIPPPLSSLSLPPTCSLFLSPTSKLASCPFLYFDIYSINVPTCRQQPLQAPAGSLQLCCFPPTCFPPSNLLCFAPSYLQAAAALSARKAPPALQPPGHPTGPAASWMT